MSYLLLAFAISTLVTLSVIHSSAKHGHLSADHDLSGPQKFHAKPVPRIGGAGIYAGLLAAALLMNWQGLPTARMGLLVLACGLPAFAAGIIEDFTKRVSPARRLAATAVSGALGALVLGAVIVRTDIPGLDWIAATSVGGLLLAVFVVAGVANSVNIIDGFNGLSSMCVSLMLLSYGYVAFELGDLEIATWTVLGAGAILGFFVWNFPAGMVFLGDGGAYFIGFFLAEMGLLLIARHPEVSPLFALVVCIYPVFETVFSIYRRKVIRAAPPGEPDGIHLHSLIYRRLMRWAVGARDAREITRRNSMTAPYLWVLCVTSLLPALLFWRSTAALTACMLVFAVLYVGLYWRIVRFRTPKWLVFRANPRGVQGGGRGVGRPD